ncbi:MAG: ABC transporter permease [Phycisphaerales bacterium]
MTDSIPALIAPPPQRRNAFLRSRAGVLGLGFLALMVLACVGTLPWTLAPAAPPADQAPGSPAAAVARYNAGDMNQWGLPPWWWGPRDDEEVRRLNGLIPPAALGRIAAAHGLPPEQAAAAVDGPIAADLERHWPIHQHRLWFLLGSDVPGGRSLLVRSLAGGGVSLGIGIAAAMLAVFIGTMYGALSAYAGGVVDAVMMRIVDVLYGLPYVLLVVLLAVASDAMLDEYITRSGARGRWVHREAAIVARERGLDDSLTAVQRLLRDDPALSSTLGDRAAANADLQPRRVSAGTRMFYEVVVLLVAIGGVSWLTMARVVRGQVLSLKAQPFMEAARALGVPWRRQFLRHLLPNLIGPIVVYATLTVPQAILQESFLSFLGIGVKPPLPSWGNLASDGLSQLNPYRSYWWLLFFPCLFLALTLLALNFVGEGLREALDPKRSRRG